MPDRRSDDYEDEESIPLPIQTFLWRQTSPFIRPRFGRQPEALAMEQREACKSFEKVLVQNMQFGLSPSLTDAIKSISRWKLIQASLPHVMHCCAALLYNRKNSNLDKLGAAETKLLYTLHWIVLDSAEECADAEQEKGISRPVDHYFLPITTIELFIYLFSPLISYLKHSDFLTSFRLENGYKLWEPLFEYKHPDIPSFVAQVKPKRDILIASHYQGKEKPQFGGVFIGVNDKKNGLNQVISDTSENQKSPIISSVLSSPVKGQVEDEDTEETKEPKKTKPTLLDPLMATYLDVAILRCLFTSQWLEEGIDWSLNYFIKRLKDIQDKINEMEAPPPRSSSLPLQSMDMYSYNYDPRIKVLYNSKGPNFDSRFFSLTPGLNGSSKHSSFQELRRSSFSGVSLNWLESSKDSEKKSGSKKHKIRRESIKDNVKEKSKETTSYLKSDTNSASFHESKTLPPCPKSALGIRGEVKESKWCRIKFELVRGKSMPSLHLMLDKSEKNENDKSDAENRSSTEKITKPTLSFPNPIITVTEHSPVASVHFFFTQESNDSPREEFTSKSTYQSSRQYTITRSHTDSKINYYSDNNPEASGSIHYISKSGRISLLVMLKGVHSISLRDNVCSPRVCKGIINIVNMLLSMGLLQHFNMTETLDLFSNTNETSSSRIQKMKINGIEELNVHQLFVDTLMKVIRHLGCLYSCQEGHHSSEAESSRKDIINMLTQLYQSSENYFNDYFREMITKRSIQEIIDTLHALLGFCNEGNTCLSPNGKRPNVFFSNKDGRTGYSNNFGAGFNNNNNVGRKGIEGVIIGCIFNHLITRLMNMQKELKSQENMSLYHDIRQLISYVRENHGGVFRRVALSGLLETMEKMSKLSKQAKVKSEKEIDRNIYSPAQFNYHEESEKVPTQRKSFFRKKTSNASIKKVPSNQSIFEDYLNFEWGTSNNFPASNVPHGSTSTLLRINRSNSPRLSITEDENGVVCSSSTNKSIRMHGDKGKFQFVNWLKGDKTKHENLHPDGQSNLNDNGFTISDIANDKFGRRSSFQNRPSKISKKPSSHVGSNFFKARKKMEDQFKIVFGKSKSKQGVLEETMDLSRRDSFDYDQNFRNGDNVFQKGSKLVSLPSIRTGMIKFSFLLESCSPGTLPDPPLIAAILNIKAPVIARVAFYLECARFVHSCNKGDWPQWMKLNFPMFRPSGTKSTSGSCIRSRGSHVLHRNAGRMFYLWAEALGAHIDELIYNEKNLSKDKNINLDDAKKRQLRSEDENEDFLDEASINPKGDDCPFALKMAACQLLLEITAFLRETHQYLPTRSSKSSIKGDKTNFEAKTITANRRWSMALSYLGFSQTSAHSLMSLADQAHPQTAHGERRISFVLHEADGENNSDHSSNATVTNQEEHIGEDKKAPKRLSQSGAVPTVRPNLLRRATGSVSQANGSFKRRSIKLKKTDKKSKQRGSSFVEDEESSNSLIKRTDSLRSRRKVSGISEKSDTSERADISGEESPGVLSDDGQMNDLGDIEADDSELTSNMPWLKVILNLMNTLDYDCSHKHFCLPNCYRRQMRSCSRLIKVIKKIYDDSDIVPNIDNIIMKMVDDKEDALKKEKNLKKIITGPTSPLKRKISISHNVDRYVDRDYFAKGQSTYSSTAHLHHHDVEAGFGGDDSKKSLNQSKISKCDKSKENLSLKFINNQVKSLFHGPISTLIKGFLNLNPNFLKNFIDLSWKMILETDQNLSSTCSVAFILCSVKCPEYASELLSKELQSDEPMEKIKAINKFYVIWRSRYQCWQRMEEGAHLIFKIPPPMIEFTLPSPKIALPTMPVADPPWMPQVKSKVEEVTISQEQVLQKSFVTATKTRRKQQIELVHKALHDEEEKLREERENYRISSVAILNEASYEPRLYRAEELEESDEEIAERPSIHHMQTAQAVFPSTLCSAAINIINFLDDTQVSDSGSAVYEVAYKVVWHCLVEDTALFLRHLFEKLTRENQKTIFQILRRLIRFMPRLPAQAAYTLYNYLIGFIMFYVRSPVEGSQELIGTTLSVLWLVIPSVHGLFLKDLKQVLRKEQCDASLLITANVPSAKKLIVHGPDAANIPSQFPIHEDTQFFQVLVDSLDFFSINESLLNEYFLIDSKTNQMHNLSAFVRDFYFFKRSQYPQLSLVRMNPEEAFDKLQIQAFTLQFVELGKVLMSLSIVKSQYLAIQRVLFLHEELMKLPSFPRKALEANFNLYRGKLGKEILGMDTLHKIVWVRLIGRMLEVTSGFFAQSSDIHLFLNVVNGALILHCEDAAMLRLCMATYLNAAHQFKNIFSINGYLLIMPTLIRIYSNHQTNGLLCRTIEFMCKQFYIMHRKPFVLQMFGSAASILDLDCASNIGDANRVQPKAFFQLLQSLAIYISDPLDILELVDAEKPLKALDFCYQMDSEVLGILDAISLCVTVAAYAADSQRGHQMLTVLESILPLFMKHMQTLTMKKETPGGPRTELQMIHNISVCIKTLINNSEALTRNFTGPQRAIDPRSSSIKNISHGACSPLIDIDDDSHSKYMGESYYPTRTNKHQSSSEDAETLRCEFRRPRDVLLNLVSEFLSRSTVRLADLSKKVPDLHQKNSPYELLDIKSHLRLAEIAHSLLKVAPYDPQTMGCRGLIRYMNEVLPNSEWRQESMRPALIMILRRLDKMFNKIAKQSEIKRLTDWEAAKRLLKGVYSTFIRHPYIVHLPHLKSLINICQTIILGEPTFSIDSSSPSWVIALSQSPPPGFCSVAVRLIAMQILQMMETQTLETICSNAFTSPEKTEIYLLNMIYPMCIRISGGLNNVPKMRACDITFILSVILNTLNLNSKGWKSDSYALLSNPLFQSSLLQIGLLGLKIMIICFERQLSSDWYRIARCIREIASKNIGTIYLWNFIDFVVTHRNPLFILLLPLIRYKLLQKICDNDQEYFYQQLIRGRLEGQNMPPTRSRGQLLVRLYAELRVLKEDLVNQKLGTDEKGKVHGVGHRLSFAIANALHTTNSKTLHSANSSSVGADDTSDDAFKPMKLQRGTLLRGLSFRTDSRKFSRGLSFKFPAEGLKKDPKFERRTSYPYNIEENSREMYTAPAQKHENAPQSLSEPRLFRRSTILVKRGSRKQVTSPASVIEDSNINDGEIKKSIDLETVASYSDKEDSERKHRLQRQKAQSRKTFLLRKSKKGQGITNKSSDGDIISPSTLSPKILTNETKLNANLPEVNSQNINSVNGNNNELKEI